MAGRREQSRRSAMRRIQECALDLFDERGFAAVTIEQIAAAAEVSASSVYRYFGTKERLVVADEFDLMSAETLAELIDPKDPVGSLLEVVRRYESSATDEVGQGESKINNVRTAAVSASKITKTKINKSTINSGRSRKAARARDRGPWRRVRYFFTEPSVRTAALTELDRAAQRIAPLLVTAKGLDQAQSRVAANALVFGYFAALELWFLDHGRKPITHYVEEGLSPLRRIWRTRSR